MVRDDIKKLGEITRKNDFILEVEKKTLSIRLTPETIHKIDRRVDKLKQMNKIPQKTTVSSYISKIIDDFATEALNEKGDL